MITEKVFIEGVRAFSSEISRQLLCQAYYQPEAGARPLCCFQNVWEKVARDGGGPLFGWTFSYRFNPQHGDYIVATHHAVWCAPDNRLIDVTPFTPDPAGHPYTLDKYVLFLVDEAAQPFERGALLAPMPLKYFALGDSQSLREYLAELAEREEKACWEIYDGKFTPAQVSGIFLKR
jgi:hypothetical protein